jgi:feruloyl esterase
MLTAGTDHCTTARLSTVAPKNVTIKSASIVAATTDVPEHCRVLASVPTPGNTVDFLVGFPTNWNEKFVWASQGGMAGAPMNLSGGFLRSGYATGITNTGHEGKSNTVGGAGRDASFAHDPQKLIDYGHRANFVAVNAAKALIASYYSTSIKRSIFNACSNGGRSVMINAQRYPGQFDGYVVGAPVISWSQVALDFLLHSGRGFFAKSASFPTAEKMTLVGNAVLAACDADDGVGDGAVSNPLACRFDPRSLQCSGADGPTCLTKDQVDAFVTWNNDVRNSNGELVSPRWLFTGVEGEASGTSVYQVGSNPPALDEDGAPLLSSAQNNGFSLMNNVLGDMVHQDASYDARDFDIETDMGLLTQVNGSVDATDTNLMAAARKGAKFLFYHGWADPALNPMNTVNYHKALVDRYGAEKTDTFVRMFFVPGMTHCSGGAAATDTFDTNAAMEKWLDTGVAPDQIEASKVVKGAVTRTKPLCAFPKYARFRAGADGSGPAKDDASNYSCVDASAR